MLFGFRPDPGRRVRVFSRSIASVLAMLGLVFVLLTVLTVNSVRESRLHRRLDTVLNDEARRLPGVELLDWSIEEQAGDQLVLRVEVRSVDPISAAQAGQLQERVAERLQRPVTLTLSVVRFTRLEPLAMPTPAG